MKTTYQLMQIIRNNNILFEINSLPEDRLGFYQHSSHATVIIIDDSLNNDPIHFKCILAEEIGHYFTTIGDNMPYKGITYRKRVAIDKEEEKAIKWAVDYLIDTTRLLHYLSTNLYDRFDELVDYFEVTEEYLLLKLQFMGRQKLHWHIRDMHYLCLSNLPSVHIATFFDEKFASKAEEIF